MFDVAEGTIYGPMHSKAGVELYKSTVQEAIDAGGKIEIGGKVCKQTLITETRQKFAHICACFYAL